MSDDTATSLVLLVFRSVVGIVFFAHGLNHLFGGGRIAGTAKWFASLGMRPGRLHAWVASITELVVGALLLTGALVPLASAGALGVMVVAWAINHRGKGFFIFRPGEGWEYVLTLGACAATLSVLGPGAWSVDHALGLSDPPGATGLWLALGLGLGGALLLLAVSWRPPPDSRR